MISDMAHQILEDDSLFFVGATPWHGMGTELPNLATAADAIAAAGLGWEVVQETVTTSQGVELADKRINIRKDTGKPLGVVGNQYTILQNAHAFDFFDKVTQDPHGPKYETAGSLWNGRKVWILAKMPETLEVVPGDVVMPYILLSNSHDGSAAIRVMETPIRVVCQNTLNAAHSGSGKSIKVRHSGDVVLKVGQVQDALGILRHSFAETLGVYQALAKVEPTKAQIDDVLNRLFPETKSDRAKLQRERVLTLSQSGRGNDMKGVRGTAWALYNGATELVDHFANVGSKREDAKDMRLNSMAMGSGLDTKATALEIIMDVCLR